MSRVRFGRVIRWLRERRDGLRYTDAYLRRVDEHNKELVMRTAHQAMIEHRRDKDMRADSIRVLRHKDGVVLSGPHEALADVAAVLLEAARWTRTDGSSGKLGALGVAILAALARRDAEDP